jgi:predicted nucleic acid-binding protein
MPPARKGLPLAVIDNTLLSRLVELDLAEFLPFVFRLILVPPEVKREAYRTPHGTRRRLRNLIRESSGFFVDCEQVDENVKEILKVDLDEGEAAAIAQADKTDSILLIDEQKGSKRAATMQIHVVRTGNLLNMLKEAGAIRAVKPYHLRLEQLGFYWTQELRDTLLVEAGEFP